MSAITIIAEAPGTVQTIMSFFIKGGLFMWPLLACSIVAIAPLLGLIGAVSGLVHVFSNLGLSSGAADTRQIALGIAEALNATVFGLSIAVPTLIAFSYFSKKVEVMSVEMETLVVELISKCYYGRSSREVMPAKSPPPAPMPTPTPVVYSARPSHAMNFVVR